MEHRPSSALDLVARPVLVVLEDFERQARGGAALVVDAAEAALNQFELDAARAGVPTNAIKPARYGLAMLFDTRARQISTLSLNAWSVLAQRQLFEGHTMPISRIQKFQATAARRGPEFADLDYFLGKVLARAQDSRHAHKPVADANWGLRIAAYFIVLALGLSGYAVWLEHRFHARLITAFDAEVLNIGLDRDHEGKALVQRLDDLHAAVVRVSSAAERAPLRKIVLLPFGDGEAYAQAVYRDTVARQMPRAIADGIEEVLAKEGRGLVLYDALRAWSVLTGEDTWTRAYLSGWLEDNGAAAGVDGLDRHVSSMAGPAPDISPRDTLVMDQARSFAADVPEPDRAWLELLRAERMRTLPTWQPTNAVEGIETVLLRRSGRPISEGIPGLFTAAGWTEAHKFAVGGAVRRARELAPKITGRALPTVNESPDLLMDRLHLETQAAWKAWLADLRVRPFAERETGIIVSGALAQPENPLTHLLRAVWVEVGGTDRTRSHTQQLTLAREFGAMVQYLEQGRMTEITMLFSQLNVALGAVDFDAQRGSQRLMSVQDRARSITALKNAPSIIVQITEDVLAQASLPGQGQPLNPLTRGWQQQVFPLCRNTLAGYPFREGPDVHVADLDALLGPQGALTVFVRQSAAPFLETSESPWRWKPEARFAGVTPESAEFLQRAMQVSEGLFGPQGQLNFDLTLAALAERGRTIAAIGGVAQPVRATGAPANLSWPGPQPNMGIEVSFRESETAERILHSGTWGLLRLVDGLRVRQRDGGRRMLLDIRSASGRVFLEMEFQTALNPISVRTAMQELACPLAL